MANGRRGWAGWWMWLILVILIALIIVWDWGSGTGWGGWWGANRTSAPAANQAPSPANTVPAGGAPAGKRGQ